MARRPERAILPFSERSELRGTGGAAPGRLFCAPAQNIAGYLPDSRLRVEAEEGKE